MMSEVKGVKFDGEKPQWGLLPFKQVEQVVDVLTFGAKKYSPDNWKKVPDAERRYFDAMMRHIAQYKYNTKLDDETGKSHLAHAICCALFLMGFDDGEGIKLDDNDMPIKDLLTEGGTQFDLKPSDLIPDPTKPFYSEGFNPMDKLHPLKSHFIGHNVIVPKVSPHKCTLSTEPPMTPIEGVLHNIEHIIEQGEGNQFEDAEYIKVLSDGGHVFRYTGKLSEPFEYVVYEFSKSKPLVSLYNE